MYVHAPEAAFSARLCLRQPGVFDSLGQSAARAALAGQTGPCFRRTSVRAREAGQRAALGRDDTPLRTRLPEARVSRCVGPCLRVLGSRPAWHTRRVGAEHEQQAEGAAEQRVRQSDARGPRAVEAVQQADEAGDADVEEQRALDPPQDQRARQRAEVLSPVDSGVPASKRAMAAHRRRHGRRGCPGWPMLEAACGMLRR
eukprot:scaffold63398_cov54-Phaeocystis_antarctica.AAC.3